MKVVDEDHENPARGVVGRPGGRQDDPFPLPRGRGNGLVVNTAAVRQHEGDDVLLDAVFVNLEVFLF